jgi:hypothetical protein
MIPPYAPGHESPVKGYLKLIQGCLYVIFVVILKFD